MLNNNCENLLIVVCLFFYLIISINTKILVEEYSDYIRKDINKYSILFGLLCPLTLPIILLHRSFLAFKFVLIGK